MNARIAEFYREFAESKVAVICLVVAILFAGCAALAPWISPTDPYDLASIKLSDSKLAPGANQTEDTPQISINISAKDGAADVVGTSPEGDAITTKLTPLSGSKLALSIDAPELDIVQVRLRSLPLEVSVEGARKHPIKSEWTIANPQGEIILQTGGQIPAVLNFVLQVEARSAGTGIIVGAIGAIGSMLIGTFMGLVAAWFGGRVDSFIMRVVDFQLSIPSLMVGLLVLTILGKGVDRIIIAIILIQWTYFARTARSVALAELRKDYVEAAKCLRFSAWRINVKHILPNCLPPLLVILTINIASAITLEASLSFLGVGLPLTQPSLGMLISNGYEYMFSNMYWIAIYPGLVLLAMIISINVVGDRLRDMFNPQLKR
jgi:peptide/nickel transport system permease protein